MKKLFHKPLFLKQPKRIIVIQGACKKCGSCCREINLCEDGKWVLKKSHFLKMVVETPEYERLHITGKNKNGILNFSCTWLNSDNQCQDYQNRLDICKVFPNKMFIKNQDELPKGCGFKVIHHSSFDAMLKQTIRRDKIFNRWQRIKSWFCLQLCL
jgi:hypothetical protein